MIPKNELHIGNRYLLNAKEKKIESGADIDSLPDIAEPILLTEENLDKYFTRAARAYWHYKYGIYIYRNANAFKILNEVFGTNQPLQYKNTILLREDLGDRILKQRVTTLHEFENFIFFLL